MKKIFVVFVVCICFVCYCNSMHAFVILNDKNTQFITRFSNDTSFYSSLREPLRLLNKDFSRKNLQNLANVCDRIIMLNPDHWLPYYYTAYAHINLSAFEKNNDQIDLYCDEAQSYIDLALEIKPQESELLVLQAWLYFEMMRVNSMARGMIYFPKAENVIKKAIECNPQNPRIYFLKGKSTLYKPEFLGGGKKAALSYLEKAVELYVKVDPKSDIHPAWGKSSTIKLLESCKKGK